MYQRGSGNTLKPTAPRAFSKSTISACWHYCHRDRRSVIYQCLQWTHAKVNNHTSSDLMKDILKNIFIYLCDKCTKSACGCSQWALTLVWVKRAGGRLVVTAFQDLCLGAPLSDVLLLLPLECVVRDTTTTIKKKKKKRDGAGRNSESCGSLSQKATSHCYQGNSVSLRHTGLTFAIRAIRL